MTDICLLIPHIKIQNANALSSPYTIGFPAMTAWMGAVHALQRHLNTSKLSVKFDGVGVVSHQFQLQTFKGPGDYEYSIIGTSNPLEPKPEKGKPKGNAVRSSFIEEARCHLEVSLIIQCSNIRKLDEPKVIDRVEKLLHARMKIAGGDILAFQKPQFYRNFNMIRSRLMPGYALIERRELLLDTMEQGQDPLDAMLDYLALHHHCEQQEKKGDTVVSWSSTRKKTGQDNERGWIVPIATGFYGISALGKAENQRSQDTLHRFAEAVVTLGEFKMIYKLESLKQILWHYVFDEENYSYLCQQQLNDSQLLFELHGF